MTGTSKVASFIKNLAGISKPKTPDGTRYFTVCSHGRTGTVWLRRALHMHPDIICAHSIQFPPVTELIRKKKKTSEDHDEHISSLGKRDTTIDAFFDEILKAGEAKAFGSVHSYALGGLHTYINTHDIRRDYTIVNMIRHPVPRIESWVNFFISYWGASQGARTHFESQLSAGKNKQIDVADILTRKYGLNLDDDNVLAFVTAANFIISELDDLTLDYPHIIMERMVSDPQYYVWLVRKLAGNDISFSDEYINSVFQMGKANSHVKEFSIPEKTYLNWEDWKKDIFSIICHELGAESMYYKYGYDLSFVK